VHWLGPNADPEAHAADPLGPNADPEVYGADPEAHGAGLDAHGADPVGLNADPEAHGAAPESHAPAPQPSAPAPDREVPTPDPSAPAPDRDGPAPDPEAPAPDHEAPAPDPKGPAPDPEADPGPPPPMHHQSPRVLFGFTEVQITRRETATARDSPHASDAAEVRGDTGAAVSPPPSPRRLLGLQADAVDAVRVDRRARDGLHDEPLGFRHRAARLEAHHVANLAQVILVVHLHEVRWEAHSAPGTRALLGSNQYTTRAEPQP